MQLGTVVHAGAIRKSSPRHPPHFNLSYIPNHATPNSTTDESLTASWATALRSIAVDVVAIQHASSPRLCPCWPQSKQYPW